ncbi:hypothetical protein ACQ33O_09010 [Ferruginibacter sp. SUN002]|uniref:hypothetical protein n=1 Tax=Ferruginibacter sp. SUN002 TaxID=2937789 RepID=UPI003D36C78F
MSSCSLGMLLFYRDSKTSTVYKSSDSKKDYFKIDATTLSHCGCTQLTITNYKNGERDFIIRYGMGTYAGKIIYKNNSVTKESDTVWLKFTTLENYTIKFNSIDSLILKVIDSFAVSKPKGVVYPINKPMFKGYIKDLSKNK